MQEKSTDIREKMMDSLLAKRRYGDIVFMLVVIVLLIAIIAVFTVFQDCEIVGQSMCPTFSDKDRVLLNVYPTKIARNDIVTFYYEADGKNIVKRVIGVPGDKLKFQYSDDGVHIVLYLDTGSGYVLADESFTNGPMLPSLSFRAITIGEEITVKSGHYFVLGDNRNNSTDSRMIDQISKEMINGKYIMTLKQGSFLYFVFNPGFKGERG